MKLLSDASEYALRATVWLAQRPADQPGKVREIADATQSAPGYLIKVLQDLARAGILTAQRGSRGGFQLARRPAELTVLDIINAVDPVERITTCPLGIAAHGTSLCPMHRQIDQALALIEETFANITIEQVLSEPPETTANACTALIGCSTCTSPNGTSQSNSP